MPALANARHERFAQELSKGKSQVEAHETAGFKAHRGNASSLAQSKSILERVAEIQAEHAHIARAATEKAAERLSIDREWVMTSLVENANIALGRQKVKVTIKPRGADVTVDLEVSMRDAAAANTALNLLGKELGMFVERTENVNIEHVVSGDLPTADEWETEHGTAH